ncbi:MAG: DUF1565 domain-containing protein [Patescibacteria group bacterium]
MVRKKSRSKIVRSKKKKKQVVKPVSNSMIKILAVIIIVILSLSIVFALFNKNNKSKEKSEEVNIGVGASLSPTNKSSSDTTSDDKIGINYFVDPNKGNDNNTGISKELPLKTIQKALVLANPSDVINLLNGNYFQDVVSVRDGLSNAPITIKGKKQAIVRGAGSPRVIEINHNNIHLEGFTIDGLVGDPNDEKSYRDKLIYVLGKKQQNEVTGLKITKMTIQNSGGECVRLRYFVVGSEVSYNTIGPCGVFDFKFESDNKNGEGIYLGTSADQWSDGKNPTSGPDKSTKNYIHHNIINTQGNECVDIKEGSSENIVEYNSCTGQMDPQSGGLDARGDKNTFRYNLTFGNKGAGVRLGGHTVDGIIYGLGNNVYGNTFKQNQAGGLKIETEPQGKICGNNMSENGSKEVFGSKADNYYPTSVCN